jgi:TPR repeat protein
MRRLAAAVILIISLLLAVPAIAEPFEDATKAYYRGDYETAYRLIKPLAEQGLPEAQFNLGLMHDNGQGVPQNYSEAVKWYRKAAEQGNAKGQYSLGMMYNKGQGVPQDHAEAVKWYRKAAEQGNAKGQYNLGMMYYRGRGVPKDYVLAHMWLSLTTSQSPALKKAKREWAEIFRDIAASKMTPAQIAEAQKLAREWKPKMER